MKPSERRRIQHVSAAKRTTNVRQRKREAERLEKASSCNRSNKNKPKKTTDRLLTSNGSSRDTRTTKGSSSSSSDNGNDDGDDGSSDALPRATPQRQDYGNASMQHMQQETAARPLHDSHIPEQVSSPTPYKLQTPKCRNRTSCRHPAASADVKIRTSNSYAKSPYPPRNRSRSRDKRRDTEGHVQLSTPVPAPKPAPPSSQQSPAVASATAEPRATNVSKSAVLTPTTAKRRSRAAKAKPTGPSPSKSRPSNRTEEKPRHERHRIKSKVRTDQHARCQHNDQGQQQQQQRPHRHSLPSTSLSPDSPCTRPSFLLRGQQSHNPAQDNADRIHSDTLSNPRADSFRRSASDNHLDFRRSRPEPGRLAQKQHHRKRRSSKPQDGSEPHPGYEGSSNDVHDAGQLYHQQAQRRSCQSLRSNHSKHSGNSSIAHRSNKSNEMEVPLNDIHSPHRQRKPKLQRYKHNNSSITWEEPTSPPFDPAAAAAKAANDALNRSRSVERKHSHDLSEWCVAPNARTSTPTPGRNSNHNHQGEDDTMDDSDVVLEAFPFESLQFHARPIDQLSECSSLTPSVEGGEYDDSDDLLDAAYDWGVQTAADERNQQSIDETRPVLRKRKVGRVKKVKAHNDGKKANNYCKDEKLTSKSKAKNGEERYGRAIQRARVRASQDWSQASHPKGPLMGLESEADKDRWSMPSDGRHLSTTDTASQVRKPVDPSGHQRVSASVYRRSNERFQAVSPSPHTTVAFGNTTLVDPDVVQSSNADTVVHLPAWQLREQLKQQRAKATQMPADIPVAMPTRTSSAHQRPRTIDLSIHQGLYRNDSGHGRRRPLVPCAAMAAAQAEDWERSARSQRRTTGRDFSRSAAAAAAAIMSPEIGDNKACSPSRRSDRKSLRTAAAAIASVLPPALAAVQQTLDRGRGTRECDDGTGNDNGNVREEKCLTERVRESGGSMEGKKKKKRKCKASSREQQNNESAMSKGLAAKTKLDRCVSTKPGTRQTRRSSRSRPRCTAQSGEERRSLAPRTRRSREVRVGRNDDEENDKLRSNDKHTKANGGYPNEKVANERRQNFAVHGAPPELDSSPSFADPTFVYATPSRKNGRGIMKVKEKSSALAKRKSTSYPPPKLEQNKSSSSPPPPSSSYIPAWQLRESLKAQSNHTNVSNASSANLPPAFRMVKPDLPPAFRNIAAVRTPSLFKPMKTESHARRKRRDGSTYILSRRDREREEEESVTRRSNVASSLRKILDEDDDSSSGTGFDDNAEARRGKLHTNRKRDIHDQKDKADKTGTSRKLRTGATVMSVAVAGRKRLPMKTKRTVDGKLEKTKDGKTRIVFDLTNDDIPTAFRDLSASSRNEKRNDKQRKYVPARRRSSTRRESGDACV